MSVVSTAPYTTATGNGVVTSFPFAFACRNVADVAVYVNGIVQNAGIAVTLGTDFNSGTVAFTTAPANGAAIIIASVPSIAQQIQFENAGAYNPITVDGVADAAAIRSIYLAGLLARSPLAPIGEAMGAIPAKASRIGKFFGFDASGNPSALSGTGNDSALRTDLAASSGAALAGFIDDGTGAVATSVQEFLRRINQKPTGLFLSPTAKIQRLNDRVFVGDAAANDGSFPNITQDWYTTYEVAQGRANGIIVSAQAAVLTNSYAGAAVACVFASRTSTLGVSAGGAVGLEAHVVNDNVTTTHSAWAGYSEATRNADGVGSIITWEMDARNKGVFHAITPYAQDPKMSVTLQLASGAGLGSGGVDDISAFINFRDNPTKAGVGIVFGANSIRGTNGVTGTGNAIGLATCHRITWFLSDGTESASVQSTITAAANACRLAFLDSGATILGPSDTANFVVPPVTSAANYLKATAGATGVAPIVEATGSDTNVDLKLTTKGSGVITFGNAANMAANGSVATVLGSVGPSGSHTGVQEWLQVKNSAGVVRYIPAW